jgi:hypothetical protein
MALTRREKDKKAVRFQTAKKRMDQHDVGFVPATIKVPTGVKLFRFAKEGTYLIDIGAYICGKGNPYCDPGLAYYEYTYYAHKDVGPTQIMVVCPDRTAKKPCGICPEIQQRFAAKLISEEARRDLRAKERRLFWVRDRNNIGDGWQLFEVAHWMHFGELLDNKLAAARTADEDNPFLNFWHPVEGFSLQVSVKETAYDAGVWKKPTNIEFVPRKKQFGMELLEKLTPLEDLLVWTKPEEMRKLFLQIPKKGGKDEPEETEEEETEGETEEVEEEEEETEATEEETEETEEEESEEENETGFTEGQLVTHKKTGKEYEVKEVKDGKLKLQNEDGKFKSNVDPDDVEAVEVADESSEEEEEESEETEESEESEEGNGEPTADQYGLEVGDKVTYQDKEWSLVHISGDGTSLKLKDAKGKVKSAVGPDEVEKVEASESEEEEEAETEEEEQLEEEAETEEEEVAEEEEDEAPPVRKPKPKPGKKPATAGKKPGKKPGKK